MSVLPFRRREEDGPPSSHWLLFNAAREVTGCACGFEADMESDCGWGDSVVDHLVDVGQSTDPLVYKGFRPSGGVDWAAVSGPESALTDRGQADWIGVDR